MSQFLLIGLPADQEAVVDWLLWDDEAGCVVHSGALANAGELGELQALSRRHATYAIVPGEQAFTRRVVVPAAGRVGQAALPYQLEEQLCGELDEQHIAHEKLLAGRPCLVSVVARDLMTQWRQSLQAGELRVKALVPDYFLLPDETVLLTRDRAIVRSRGRFAALERDNLECWWTLAAASESHATGEPAAGEAIGLPLLLEADPASGWLPPHSERRTGASALESLAAHWQEPLFSLLQGDCLLRDPWQELRRRARWPAAAVALVLAMHWAVLGAEIIRLGQEARAFDDAVMTTYREAFPDEQRVVNPRSQMRARLQRLEQRHGHSPLLPWMQRTALAMRDRGDIAIRQLQYQLQPHQLRLSLRAESYGAVDRLTEALREQQLQVERGSFGQQDREIRGQLMISGAMP